jgi:hypothetical protein
VATCRPVLFSYLLIVEHDGDNVAAPYTEAVNRGFR